jgi:hypothetical protein
MKGDLSVFLIESNAVRNISRAIGKINQKDEMELNIIDKVLNGET